MKLAATKALETSRLKTIRSENMWIRLGSMWIVGLVVLLATWVLSFRVVPEGAVRGSAGVYYVPLKAEDAMATFARFFLWNLCVGCIPVALGNLVRVKGFPLGYALTFYHWGMYGVLLGTNSFLIPGPGKFLPSLTTLFYGSGIYEISSYTLISSATFSPHSRHGNSSKGLSSVGKSRWNALRLSKVELAVIASAILILAVSNYYEAWSVFHV